MIYVVLKDIISAIQEREGDAGSDQVVTVEFDQRHSYSGSVF